MEASLISICSRSSSNAPGSGPNSSSVVNQTLPAGAYTDVFTADSNGIFGLLTSGEVVSSAGRAVPHEYLVFADHYGIGITTDGTVRSFLEPYVAFAP